MYTPNTDYIYCMSLSKIFSLFLAWWWFDTLKKNMTPVDTMKSPVTARVGEDSTCTTAVAPVVCLGQDTTTETTSSRLIPFHSFRSYRLVANQVYRVQPVLIFNPLRGESRWIHSFPRSISAQINITNPTKIRTWFSNFSFLDVIQ